MAKEPRSYQRAVVLNEDDEGAWWNLGIAATALHEWDEAARAWKRCGLRIVEIRDAEVYAPCGKSCVRVNPQGEFAEVLWGDRLDPARIRIDNIPLPRTKRRFGDIILNDGSGEGTRVSEGEEFPVFDELEIWQKSQHSTFSSSVTFSEEAAESELEAICRSADVVMEDWGTITMLCEACTRGNPSEHVCAMSAEPGAERDFGFAATSRDALDDVLTRWISACPASSCSAPRLELSAL